MDGRRKGGGVRQHQLAHVLPRHADDLRHVGQADQVGRGLDQRRRGHGAAHVGQRAAHGRLGAVGLAGEFEHQAAGQAHAHQGVVAAGLAQTLDQSVQVAVGVGQLVFEGEEIFHGLLLAAARMRPAMPGAVIHHAPQGARVVARVPGGAPDAGDAELAATAFAVVVWAVHAPPGMAAPSPDVPAVRLGMLERGVDVFVWVRATCHAVFSSLRRSVEDVN
ncbi:Uncharacterised protein [Bordetella pertussis]|nr:Uncharacterised protein [Bordetella pertussis]CPI78352.1 Uncharacterised protein [Bordetella pertussis]CPI99047.1 Uncharacterised protein [Bordetella pertussis]CPK19778.1 Uncharacterised protein [Bordetella pertussis]CPK82665.1 Uncharacterised protein [Bordetella pertussis]